MNLNQRLSAFAAYLPVIGWIYVIIFQRNNALAMFHVRQSIGVVLFLAAAFASWAAALWILSWVPYAFVLGVALFTLVIVAVLLGIVAWIMGAINALRGRVALLPLFGKMANRLPL